MMSDVFVEREKNQDIIVYRFHQSGRKAVDQYLELISQDAVQHLESKQSSKSMFYVIDVSASGMYPLNYMRREATRVMGTFDAFPKSYIAYVVDNPNDSVLVNMVNAITIRELQNSRRVFKVEQMDDAIAWLIEERSRELAE